MPPCLDGMIVTDLELGADGIGAHLHILVKHADVITMTPWSRTAWIGTTWSPGNTIRATTHPMPFFPMTQSNYQQNFLLIATLSASTSQLHDAVSSEPTPAKTVKPMMPPLGHAPVHPSQTTTSPGHPVQPQKAWLTPPDEWQPGDGMLDINQLYSFSLPMTMTVANTPHNLRDMSGMGIRDVRLVQVIHGGISNWLLRPFAHGRFVTWEGFRTRTEALLWSTCSKLLRRSQPLNLLTLEKDLANSLGLNIDDFNQRIKVHDHLANLVLQFLQQHHETLTPSAQEDDMLKKYNNLDDAELVTPPPVNHSQSPTPTSSLPTVSAAALDGRSFDVPSQQQPRIIQPLHGLSPPPSKPLTPQLLTMHSTPEDIIKHYTWTSDQPRLCLKQAPTTTTVPSLVKWANHSFRLNGNKSLEPGGPALAGASTFPKR